jgi:hypothetical protein
MPIHLVSGSLDRELPIDFDPFVTPFFDKCSDLFLQLLDGWDAPVQTLTHDSRKLDLGVPSARQLDTPKTLSSWRC